MRKLVETPSLKGLTPSQKLRSMRTLQALRDGSLKIPLCCEHCQSTTVGIDEDTLDRREKPVLHCDTCGGLTDLALAHRLRVQKLKAVIINGGKP